MSEEKYCFDPPADVTLKEMVDMFRHFLVDIDEGMYLRAPENIRKMFRPSILSPSPSKRLN